MEIKSQKKDGFDNTGNAAVDGELLGVEFTKQTNSGSLQVSWFTDGLVVGKKVSGS